MARLSDRVVTGAPNGILSNDEPIQWYAADGITLIDGIKVDAAGAVYLAPAGGPTEVGGDLDVTGTTTGSGYLYLESKTANQGLRLNNTTKIQSWNAAGTNLRSLMQLDASNDLRIGSSANPIYLDNDTTVTGNLATGGDVTIENATPILDITYTGTSGRIDFNDSADAVKSRIIYSVGTGLSIGANGTAAAITIADGTNDVSVSGALSKGSGSFRIDHPLKPETHQLVHSFTESPQADLLYSGTSDLVDGAAEINLDEYHGMTEGTFVALNRNIRVFTTNESDWEPIKGSVTGNILSISCRDASCSDKVSWMVIGERQDKHMMDTDWTDEQGRVIVEPLKPEPEAGAE